MAATLLGLRQVKESRRHFGNLLDGIIYGCSSYISSLNEFQEGKVESFDAHVGDCNCQLRAAILFELLSNSDCERTNAFSKFRLELGKALAVLEAKRQEFEKQLSSGFVEADFPRAALGVDLLRHWIGFDLSFLVPESHDVHPLASHASSFRFLACCFLLSRHKVRSTLSSGQTIDRLQLNLLHNAKLSRSELGSLQEYASSRSVAFVLSLPNMERFSTLARGAVILFRVRRFCASGYHDVQFRWPLDCGVARPTQHALIFDSLSIEGDFAQCCCAKSEVDAGERKKCSDSSCVQSWHSELSAGIRCAPSSVSNIEQLLLCFFAQHEQYPGKAFVAAENIFWSGIPKPTDETGPFDIEDVFKSPLPYISLYKKRADNAGVSRANMSRFLPIHVHCGPLVESLAEDSCN